MNTIKFTGRTEEDAVRKAAATFSIPEKSVYYKIVSRSSGLLSMLGQSVTIEVTLGDRGEPVAPAPRRVEQPVHQPVLPPLPEVDEESPEAGVEALPGQSVEDGPPRQAEQPGRSERPRQQDRPRGDRPRGDRPQGDRPRGDRPQGDRSRRPDRPRPPRPERQQAPLSRGSASDGDEEMETRVVDEEVFARKLEHARTLLTDMVRLMGSEAQVLATRKEAQIEVSLSGQLPDWMGRGHSRPLEALQFIANKIVNRFPPRHRVVLLRDGQQDNHLENVEAAAARMAGKVAETGQSLWIVPMNARERRMVHIAVAAIPGIATRSVGDGPGRRLCIYREKGTDAPVAD